MANKKEKLERILKDGKLVVIPMDDGLLNGPVGGLKDIKTKVKMIHKGKPDAVLGFMGVKLHCAEELGDTPFILNLTASNEYFENPQRKVQVYTVEHAAELGADGVAVHVNIGSVYQPEETRILGRVAGDCLKQGMPLLAIVYPRGELVREDAIPQAIAYSARYAAELGADIVKTKYTGDKKTFQEVVEGTPIPVIMAGGPQISDEQILGRIHDCIQVGGAGVALGRNSFHREKTTAFINAVKGIVHEGKTVEDVINYLK